jgi:hypothetical protein
MNGRFQMQGGKNWILPKERNANRFFGTLIGWKSGQTTYFPLWDRMEGSWLWTLGAHSIQNFHFLLISMAVPFLSLFKVTLQNHRSLLLITGSGLTSSVHVHALQRKSHLCIPILGIARPQSQFLHSCVSEHRAMYSQDRSTYFPAEE